ncbi:MAG: hypothetical protein WC602_03420 [archaeon]
MPEITVRAGGAVKKTDHCLSASGGKPRKVRGKGIPKYRDRLKKDFLNDAEDSHFPLPNLPPTAGNAQYLIHIHPHRFVANRSHD